jgi:hypothetical protein
MKTLVSSLFLSLLLSDVAWSIEELKPTSFQVALSDAELSGMTIIDDTILYVSDGGADTTILSHSPKDNHRFALIDWLDLKKLTGYSEYEESLANVKIVKKKHRRFDLEGIASCGDKIYLANERVREVLVVSNRKSIAKLPIDFSAHPKLNEGKANAGLEGVAVDCKKQILYVMKERDPRLLFKIDLKTNKIVKSGDFAGSNRQGQKVIDPFSGEGLMEIGPDTADLFFTDGFLYALERNTFEVTKINPDTFAVISRVSYFGTERLLYETPEPFGLAEALYITNTHILIAFDNNHFPLSRATEKKYGVTGTQGALIYFERPKGF